MSKPLIGMLFGMLLALPVAAQDTAAAPAPTAATEEQQLVKFLDDIQASEAEIVSKAVTLTVDEAAAFWPVFKKYQAEQRPVIDGQITAVRQYAANFASLSEDDAVAYVESLLDRDRKINDLRVKYLAEYSRVIGKNKAARVIHVSRSLGLAAQTKLASEVPLVH